MTDLNVHGFAAAMISTDQRCEEDQVHSHRCSVAAMLLALLVCRPQLSAPNVGAVLCQHSILCSCQLSI